MIDYFSWYCAWAAARPDYRPKSPLERDPSYPLDDLFVLEAPSVFRGHVRTPAGDVGLDRCAGELVVPDDEVSHD
jgi:hypothetical protein